MPPSATECHKLQTALADSSTALRLARDVIREAKTYTGDLERENRLLRQTIAQQSRRFEARTRGDSLVIGDLSVRLEAAERPKKSGVKRVLRWGERLGFFLLGFFTGRGTKP